MTITLNAAYATFAAGASVDLDNATEAALVSQGRAVYTVNPGSVFAPLTAVEQQALRKNAGGGISGFTVATYDGSNRCTGYVRGLITYVITYPANKLVVTGSDGSVMTATIDGSNRFTAVA